MLFLLAYARCCRCLSRHVPVLVQADADTQGEKCPGATTADEKALSCFTAPGELLVLSSFDSPLYSPVDGCDLIEGMNVCVT